MFSEKKLFITAHPHPQTGPIWTLTRSGTSCPSPSRNRAPWQLGCPPPAWNHEGSTLCVPCRETTWEMCLPSQLPPEVGNWLQEIAVLGEVSESAFYSRTTSFLSFAILNNDEEEKQSAAIRLSSLYFHLLCLIITVPAIYPYQVSPSRVTKNFWLPGGKTYYSNFTDG